MRTSDKHQTAQESGAIEVVIPSGNRRCKANWNLEELKDYQDFKLPGGAS